MGQASFDLTRILANVTRPIPPPAIKEGKPRSSFRGMKLNREYSHPELGQWKVVQCTSQSATLMRDGIRFSVLPDQVKQWSLVNIRRPRKVRP